jgi:hypothetical protein
MQIIIDGAERMAMFMTTSHIKIAGRFGENKKIYLL